MKIHTKLTTTFAVLAVIVLVVSAVSLQSLADANHHFTQYVHGLMARGEVAQKFRRAVDERAIAVRNLVLVNKPADLETEKGRVTDAHARVVQQLALLKDMLNKATDASDKDRALVVDMDKTEAIYTPLALSIVNLALKDKRDEAIAKMNDECRPLLAALIKTSDAYAERQPAGRRRVGGGGRGR